MKSNIFISEICGLCAGCKYAIKTAEDCKKKFENVTIFKDIVHNFNVNKRLKDLGIEFVYEKENLNPNSHVILRAHGEPPETYEFLQQKHIAFTDCTCANARKIHEAVKAFSDQGYQIVIIGKHGNSKATMHPEIVGTLGWCNGNGLVIENFDDLDKLKNIKSKKVYLVCQTTFNANKAKALVTEIEKIAKKQGFELTVNLSICSAQLEINRASCELAKQMDLMIVVGSEQSSNSVELAKNLSSYTKTVMLENVDDIETLLKNENIKISRQTKIGLTAGASVDKSELAILKSNLEKLLEKEEKYGK